MNTPYAFATALSSRRIVAARAWLLPLAVMVAFAGMVCGDDQVSVSATTPTAVENPLDPQGSQYPGLLTFSLATVNPTQNVVISYQVVYNTALALGTDFSITPQTLTDVAPTGGAGVLTGTITISKNTTTASLIVAAIDNTKLYDRNARQLVFSIPTSANYVVLAQSSATIQLTEGDQYTTVNVPLPNATKQQIPENSGYDLTENERGIVDVEFNTTPSSLTAAATADPTGRYANLIHNVYLTAQFTESDVVGDLIPTASADYTSTWKVGGPSSGFKTGSNSGTTAINYFVYAGLKGDTSLYIYAPSTATPLGSGMMSPGVISFASDPSGTQYTLTITTGVSGLTSVSFSPALNLEVPAGTVINDWSSGTETASQFNVVGTGAAPYYQYDSAYIPGYGGGGYGGTAAQQVLKVLWTDDANGFNAGDVFQIGTDTTYYVVTAATNASTLGMYSGNYSGSHAQLLSFRAFYDNGAQTLGQAITSAEIITTVFPVTLTSSGISNLIPIPPEATHVEFAVNPNTVLAGSTPTGARAVTIDLENNVDFGAITPSAGTVTIADAANVVNITTASNATAPNAVGSSGQDGAFMVTVQGSPFTTDITIPFQIQTNTGGTIPTTNAVFGTDYLISNITVTSTTVGGTPTTQYLGTVTLPAGQTSVAIPVIPLIPEAVTNPLAVTVSLLTSVNYLLATSQNASVDPTATLNILPSQGVVQISAPALSTATSPPSNAILFQPHAIANDGILTISLPGVTSVPVVVGFSVSSNTGAQAGVDYSIVSYSPTPTPAEGVNSQINLVTLSGTVTLPAGSNPTAYLAVVPLDSHVAHSTAMTVTVTLAAGSGYTVNAGANPGGNASIVIAPNSPVVSMASLSSTLPLLPLQQTTVFSVSCTANANNSSGLLPVTFVLGGTAVQGVDYSVSTNTTQANTINLSGTTTTAATADISITTLSTASSTYPKTVTVTLTSAPSGSPYLITSTAPTTTPSTPNIAADAASITISPPASFGLVGIVPLAPFVAGTSPANSITQATEAPAASYNASTDNGVFQVSLCNSTTYATLPTCPAVPVVVNFAVTSSNPAAVAGVNYILTDGNGNTLLSSGTTGTVTIPAGNPASPQSAIALIYVVPIAQTTAHQPLPLTITLQQSTYGPYTIPSASAPLSASASAQITSDEPSLIAYASGSIAGPFTSQAATVNLPNTGYFQLTPASFYPFSAITATFVLGGTAVLGTDYTVNVPTTGTSGSIQIGSLGAQIAVTPTQSTLGGKTITLTLQPGPGYWFLTPASDPIATISVPVPADQGYVSVAPMVPFAPGGGVTLATEAPPINLTSADYGVFQVSLHSESGLFPLHASIVPVSVNFQVFSGSPASVAGVNYTLIDGAGNTVLATGTIGAVIIPAGQSSQTIQIVPIAQATAHQPLPLTLYLEPSSNGRYDVPAAATALSTSAAAQIDSDQPSLIAYASANIGGPFTSQTAAVNLPNPGYFQVSPTTNYPFSAFTATFTLGGTAVLGTDYTLNTTASGTTGSVQVGPTGALITVTPTPTTFGNKTITLTLQNGAGYWFLTPGTDPTATITVPMPGDQGLVQITSLTSATVPSAPNPAIETTNSGHNAALDDGVFMVSLPAPASFDVTVNFVASSGPGQAVAGVNYLLTSSLGETAQLLNTTSMTGSVVIPQGSQSAFIYLEPLFSAVAFSSLPVTLTVAPGSNYDATNGIHTSPSTASINIDSTTSPIVTLGATVNAIVPASPGTFAIVPTDSLGNPYYGGTPYIVTFGLGGTAVLGTDYSVSTNTGSSSTVQIGSAQGSTVTITPLIDEVGTKTVILTLQTGGSTTYLLPGTLSSMMSLALPGTALTLGFTTSPNLVIAGDPTPVVAAMTGYPSVAAPLTGYALVTSAVNHFPTDDGVLTISLPGVASAPVDINFIASGGTGYAVAGTNYQVTQIVSAAEGSLVMNNSTLTGTVQIPAGQSAATIAIVPLDDGQAHQPLPVTITLVAGPGYTVAGTTPQTVWVINQAPTLLISTSPATAAIAPATTGTFQITPTNYAGSPLTVPFLLSGTAVLNTDYTMTITSSSGTLLSTVTTANTSASIGSPTPVFLNIIPKSSAGNKTVTIKLQSGTSYWFVNDPADADATMTIGVGPSIALVTPSFGNTTGGTSVTISGSNLGGTTGVTFGGVAATIVGTPSASAVVCTTPAGAGVADVVLTTGLGSTTDSGAFTYEGTPTITSLSATSGPVAGGTSMTITGTNLLGTSGVTFGGTAATSVTVVSATSLTLVTPAGTGGAVNVVLTTPVGQATDAGGFTYLLGVPTITTITPAFGTVAGGTTVTITGTNLATTTAVSFGGLAATSVTVNSATSISCVTPVPVGAGSVAVMVTTSTNSATATNGYVYEAAPIITALSPVNGSLNGGTIVTITGTGLDGTSVITFGGTSATNVTVTSSTSVTCTTPPGSAGLANVLLTTPFGTTAPSSFNYHAQTTPVVVWASPSAISYGTALSVTQLDATTSTTTGTFVYTPGSATVLPAGTHTLSVTFTPTDTLDYATVTTTTSITVTPVALTVTAANQTMVAGGTLPTLTATYSGFVNGDTKASLTTQAVLHTTASASSPAGAYAITVSGATDSNYAITFVPGTLTVTAAGSAASSSASTSNGSNFFKCGNGSGVSALAALLFLILRAQLGATRRRSGRGDD